MGEQTPYEETPRGRLTSIGLWKLGRTLGRGAYGHVRQATHASGHQAACKILPALHSIPGRIPTRDEVIDAMESHKEVVLLKAMTGAGVEGIVNLEGVIEEEGWTYVFITICPIAVSGLNLPLSVPIIIPLFRRILHAVHCLHKLHISHEDIKRHNILIKDKRKLVPVLSDFGFSLFWPNKVWVKSCGGTLEYSSPQKVADEWYEPRANDVWALGIMFCKMMSIPHPLVSPGSTQFESEAKRCIIEDIPSWPWDYEHIRSGSLEEFVMCMVQPEPKDRWSIPALLLHPFLQTDVPDPKPFIPPPLSLPPELTSRPLPPSILTDLCFMSYVAGEFVLCENTMKVREALLRRDPGWEKQWAGMLGRWESRRELEWIDEPELVIKPQYKSAPHREFKHPVQARPAVLREIHLTPLKQVAPSSAKILSPRKPGAENIPTSTLFTSAAQNRLADIPERPKKRGTMQRKVTSSPQPELKIKGRAKEGGEGAQGELRTIAVTSNTVAKVGVTPKKVPARSAFGRATRLSPLAHPTEKTTVQMEEPQLTRHRYQPYETRTTTAVREQLEAAVFKKKAREYTTRARREGAESKGGGPSLLKPPVPEGEKGRRRSPRLVAKAES